MKVRGIQVYGDRAVLLLPVYGGVSPSLRGKLPQSDGPDLPPIGGIALTPCPPVVPSSRLAPADLEERLARYAKRAARRLPLFGPGRAAKPEPAVCCMGCGAVPPKRSHLHRFGWVHRVVRHDDSVRLAETYCPECAT